jgi:EmrB/QacA subfamily drug resistance transporter
MCNGTLFNRRRDTAHRFHCAKRDHIDQRSVPYFDTKRWTLIVTCCGALMMVIDTTAVVVALPTIKVDLGFPDGSIAWVVNAYLVTYAGFLLLSGRLCDIFGARRLFLFGIIGFTVASLTCAFPNLWEELVLARVIQGMAGAAVTTAALSIMVNVFEDRTERAKALGIYGFACSAGSAAGLLLGGVLTSVLSWRWIFLVNVPVCAVTWACSAVWLPPSHGRDSKLPLDLAGALTVTTSLMVTVYAVVNGNKAGWLSAQTTVSLSSAVLLLVSFIAIEATARSPLIPLSVFRGRNVVICCVASALFSVSGSAGFFVSLYLQEVLGYGALEVGLAFLPLSLIMGTFALGLSARLIISFGVKWPMALGLLLAAAGITLFARAPVGGNVAVDVLPGLILFGLGAGAAFNPILVAAMHGVPRGDSGLVSGVINTSCTVGGALGLAVLASASAIRSQELLAAGMDFHSALNAGYHVAFYLGAISAVSAATMIAALLRSGDPPAGHDIVK